MRGKVFARFAEKSPLAVLAEAPRLDEFLMVFEWFIHEVQTL